MDINETMFARDGKANWTAIAEAIGDCDERVLSYFRTLDDGNGTINNQAASVEGLGAHLQATGQSFNLAAVKATLLNTALNAGIFLAASLAIQVIAKTIDNYTHRTENAIKRTDELKETYKKTAEKLSSLKKTADELAETYDRLSKGVNTATNQNRSLSAEDYQTFLDISNQLAETFPALLQKFDKNGNAILTLGQNGQTAAEGLSKLLNVEEELNNYNISQDLGDLFGGVKAKIEDAADAKKSYEEHLPEFEAKQKELKDMFANGLDFSADTISLTGSLSEEVGAAYYSGMVEALQNFKNALDPNRAYELGASIDPSQIVSVDDNGTFQIYLNTVLLTDEEKQRLQTEIRSQAGDTVAIVSDELADASLKQASKQKAAELEWKDFIPSLIAATKSSGSFQSLADNAFGADIQNLAIELVSNLNSGIACEMNAADPYAYVRENIILPLSQLDDADRKTISEAYRGLLAFRSDDLSGMSTNEIKEVTDSYIGTIADILKKEPLALKAELGFDDSDIKTMTENVKQKLQDKFDGKIGELTPEDLQIAAELEIPEKTLLSWDELTAKIKEVKQQKRVHLSVAESLASIETLSDGLNQLERIYADIADKGTFDWGSILNNEGFKQTFGELGAAYDTFLKTVSTNPDNLQACQGA